MYSSEMVGFSAFCRKLLAPFQNETQGTSIYTHNITIPVWKKKQLHRVMKGSYEVLFFEIIFGLRELEGRNALMLEKTSSFQNI